MFLNKQQYWATLIVGLVAIGTSGCGADSVNANSESHFLSCSVDSQCESGVCSAGRCTDPSAPMDEQPPNSNPEAPPGETQPDPEDEAPEPTAPSEPPTEPNPPEEMEDPKETGALPSLAWGSNGGLIAYRDKYALGPEQVFTWKRDNLLPDQTDLACTSELPACAADVMCDQPLLASLALPDVTAALKGKRNLYGSDPRPVDGTVFELSVDDRTLLLGGKCSEGLGLPGEGAACEEVPEGLAKLRTQLTELVRQQLELGECADVEMPF